MNPALYLADTSGLFRLLQAKTGEAWDRCLSNPLRHQAA